MARTHTCTHLMHGEGATFKYLNDSLTGGEGQPHEAGVVDGHDLVSDAELAGASGGAAVHHVGQDDGGQDGSPAGLHDHHAQDLPLALLQLQLNRDRLSAPTRACLLCGGGGGSHVSQRSGGHI